MTAGSRRVDSVEDLRDPNADGGGRMIAVMRGILARLIQCQQH